MPKKLKVGDRVVDNGGDGGVIIHINECDNEYWVQLDENCQDEFDKPLSLAECSRHGIPEKYEGRIGITYADEEWWHLEEESKKESTSSPDIKSSVGKSGGFEWL